MPSWTISSRRIRDNQDQKGLDIISTLTASIANRMSHNWSSCAMFPRVPPQLLTNTTGKPSF